MKTGTLSPAQEERARQALAKVPFARLLGIELESLAAGLAVLVLPLHENLKQNSGVVHGGAIASLIDTSTAFAIITLLPEGERVTTVDLTITYLRPLVSGRARATAKVLRAGKRIIAVSAKVQGEDGSLAATALSSYLRLEGTGPT
jgi:acyl-CoA thioesterase